MKSRYRTRRLGSGHDTTRTGQDSGPSNTPHLPAVGPASNDIVRITHGTVRASSSSSSSRSIIGDISQPIAAIASNPRRPRFIASRAGSPSSFSASVSAAALDYLTALIPSDEASTRRIRWKDQMGSPFSLSSDAAGYVSKVD